ncbi:MAG: UvrD-helicase domain-containing protein [Tidjanibacter sp.]|nr:UvrD-helicase domain-containing protein [Tidjanibacter sp.]
MTDNEIRILQGLNPAQEQAVVNYEEPSLIVAGAGSGKTRVLTCRIAWMIAQGVAPWSIMALTFTNKAAKEMRERIEAMVGEKSRYIWMGTFHSVFMRILSNEAAHIGYQPSFTIYDTAQSDTIVKNIIKEMQLSDEVYKPRDVHSRISLAKNNLVTADAYESNPTLMEEDKRRRQPQFYQIYKKYCQRCKENNAMDFDDLLLNTNILFKNHPEVLEKYRQRFAYILVDEYQDTNLAQYIIIKNLSGGSSKICVVGDDAQSIYSFRGAKIENILRFQRDFPSAKIYKLEQNYRSTQTIVEAANSVIEHNQRRLKKHVFSENSVGSKIDIYKAYTDGEEAQIIADGVRNAFRMDGAQDWSQIAVLYRTNAQSRPIEEALRKRDIPYRIYGGHSFYDRKEVKDLMAYFKTIANPRDNDSLLRIINYPARGIGEVTINKLRAYAQQQGVSIWEVLTATEESQLAAISKRLLDFRKLIAELSLARSEKGLYEFGMEVATRSGILSLYKLNPSPESESALQNIEELLNSMQNYRHEMIEVAAQEEVTEPTIEQWLQNVSLLTDMDEDKEGNSKNFVTLMTVHSSKGLEFDHIFIAGLEENLFPNIISIASPDQLEEERRLFYVALTRAKRCATVTFAQTRFKWGSTEFCRPSRFIKEINPKYVELHFALDDEEDENNRSEARNQIETLKRRFDQRQGRTVVEKREFQSRQSPVQSYRNAATQQQPYRGGATAPVRPNVASMRSVGERRVVQGEGSGVGAPSPMGSAAYSVGQRVRHARFGLGTITELEMLATDVKITVEFENPMAGKKTLLSKYAKLEVL